MVVGPASRMNLAAVVAVLSTLPAVARAQSTETIEVTAAQPPAESDYEASPRALPEGAPQRDLFDEEQAEEARADEMVTVRRGNRAAAAERAAIDAIWRRHLGLGLTTGVGSALGLFGAFIEANFHPAIGVMIGGGAGGTFGPALGGTIHVRPIRFGQFAPYAGVGISTNFTTPAYRADPSLLAPTNSWWTNFEIGFEFRFLRGFAVRTGVGWNVLLNTADFTNQTVGPQYGPLSNVGVGWDPVSAADSHDEGHALGFPYVHFDALYLFNL